MKKVDLITLHRVKNYGSVLQTYASQEIIKRLNYNVEIIDYYPKRYTFFGMLFRIKNQNKYLKKSVLARFLARVLIIPSYFVRFYTFNSFLNEYLNLTEKTYSSYEELSDGFPLADIYVTGSDQVWNSEWNGYVDECLFLNFNNIKKKIAFSASFGKKCLSMQEKRQTACLLKKYNCISLREQSGVDICRDLGINNVTCVLDPTLLLTDKDWDKLIKNNDFCNQKYILVYNLNRNKKIDNYAKNLSKVLGMKVKYLSYQLHEFYKYGMMYCNPKVSTFLSLIKNAEYVVTDSFHATAFSLNFNKQFVIVYPDKFSTRIQNILDLLGLEDRVAKSDSDFSMISEQINYKKVNRLLNNMRQKSINWLKKALEDNNE